MKRWFPYSAAGKCKWCICFLVTKKDQEKYGRYKMWEKIKREV
jgi:hypothetical protein